MDEENNLKPCPLCNTIEDLLLYTEWIPDTKPGGHEVGVIECTKPSCPIIIKASNIEEVVRKWNKRPREDFLVEQNKALTEQLIIDEQIENDLRSKLTEAIKTLEYYADSNNSGGEYTARETLARIKAKNNYQ